MVVSWVDVIFACFQSLSARACRVAGFERGDCKELQTLWWDKTGGSKRASNEVESLRTMKKCTSTGIILIVDHTTWTP